MNDIIKKIKRVSFELSNVCNYASIHPKCPASKVKRPVFLSQTYVLHVLYSLYAQGYAGTIAWYIYNEPMIDPRLLKFVDYTSHLFDRKIKQRIVTNGAYLDQTLLDEFLIAGVTYFKIDCYTTRDFERSRRLVGRAETEKFKVTKKSLDDRMNLYDLPQKNLTLVCNAPYADVQVKCTGQVSLCAIDWRSTVTFGNLKNDSFDSILKSPVMRKTHEKLLSGDRSIDVCSRCNRTVTGDACLKTSKYFKEDE